MLIYRNYNDKLRLDKAWYDSSNIVYSECDDTKDELKTLRVVFKNGACYEYKNIEVQDYVMFMRGGLDGSNGKALNNFIKKNKYEYERLEDANLTLIKEELKTMQEKEKETI